MLYFWRDQPNRASSAEREWDDIDARFPNELARVETHLRRVDAGRSLASGPIRQAQRVTPGPPANLFWWDVRGIGAFYLYDGSDLAIVLVGEVANPPFWSDLRDAARNRI